MPDYETSSITHPTLDPTLVINPTEDGFAVGVAIGKDGIFSAGDLLVTPVRVLQIHAWDRIPVATIVLSLLIPWLLLGALLGFLVWFSGYHYVWEVIVGIAAMFFVSFVAYTSTMAAIATSRLTGDEIHAGEAWILAIFLIIFVVLSVIPVAIFVQPWCASCRTKREQPEHATEQEECCRELSHGCAKGRLVWIWRVSLVIIGITALFLFGLGLYGGPIVLLMVAGMPPAVAHIRCCASPSGVSDTGDEERQLLDHPPARGSLPRYL